MIHGWFKLLLISGLSILLLGCGGGGGSDDGSDSSSSQNRAPTISLSNLSVDEGETVNISAAVRDPDGDTLSYEWVQLSGPTVTLTVDDSQLSIQAPSIDDTTVLQFRLTVSDGSLTTTATVEVTVLNVNQPPTISFEPAVIQVVEGQKVEITAVVSDDSESLDFDWYQSLGRGVNYNREAAEISFTAPDTLEDYSVEFTLSVDDGELSATSKVTVEVANDTSNDSPASTIKSVQQIYRETTDFFWSDWERYDAPGLKYIAMNLSDGAMSDLVLLRDTNAADGGVAYELRFDSANERYDFAPSVIRGIARAVNVADLSNNSRDDLYLADHGSELGAVHEIGGPNYAILQDASRQLYDVGLNTPNDYTHSACLLDIDDDGYLDVFEGNIYYQDKPQVRINNGDGSFSGGDKTLLPDELLGLNSIWCLAGDFNRDGYDDLIIGIPGKNEAWESQNDDSWKAHWILFGDGERLVFDEAASVLLKTDYEYTQAFGESSYPATLFMETIDYNGDDCDDFVSHLTTYLSWSGYEVYAGDCRGGFERVYTWHTTWDGGDEEYRWSERTIVRDFNGDGLEDFFGYTLDDSELSQFYFEANDQGSYNKATFKREYIDLLPHDIGLMLYNHYFYFDDP